MDDGSSAKPGAILSAPPLSPEIHNFEEASAGPLEERYGRRLAGKRILLVGQGAPGGIGRYEVLLDAALAALSHSYAMGHRSLFRSRFPWYLPDGLQGSPHRKAGGSRVTLVARFLRQALLWRPDLILFSHVNLAPLGLLINTMNPRINYMVAAHGEEVWRPLSSTRRMALQKSLCVLAVSHYTGDMVHRFQGVQTSRIKILPNAIDVTGMGKPDARIDSDTEAHPLILTVGRMTASEGRKGVDTVIRAVSQMVSAVPNLRYTIVGEGDDLPRLRALVDGYGLHNHVSFLGTVDEKTLRQLYERCMLFTMPSGQEGFGLVFLEAMAYAKPIVAARAGGVPDVIEHDRTGLLVEYDDVKGLSAALMKLLSDPGRCRAYGQAGYERLHANFTLDRFTDRLGGALAGLAADD